MMGGYKFYWMGCNEGFAGVGVMVVEGWVDRVKDVVQVSERIIVIKLIVGMTAVNIVSVYAPQVGKKPVEKEKFYSCLNRVLSRINELETVVIAGDFNGHIGELVI